MIVMTKKRWMYLLTIIIAVSFNSFYATWPEFKDQVPDIIWTVVNTILGVCVAIIRVWGVFSGLPTEVDDIKPESKD